MSLCLSIIAHPAIRVDLLHTEWIVQSHKSSTVCIKFSNFYIDCMEPQDVGDFICHDLLNNPRCDFDGGDCCLPIHIQSDFHCQKCQCLNLHNYTTSTAVTNYSPTSKFGAWR